MSSHDLDVQRAVDEAVLHPPAMHIGVDGVMQGGRRRERRRRLTTAGMSLAAVLLVVTGWFGLGNGAEVLGDRIAPTSVPTWDDSVSLDEPIYPFEGGPDTGIYGASISRDPDDAHFRVTSQVGGTTQQFDPVDAELPGGAELFRVGDERLVVVPTLSNVDPELVLKSDLAGSIRSWTLDTEGGPLAFAIVEPREGLARQLEATDLSEVVYLVPGAWWGRDANVLTGTGAVVHREVLELQEDSVELFLVDGADVWGQVGSFGVESIVAGGKILTMSATNEGDELVIAFVPRGSTDLYLAPGSAPDQQFPLTTVDIGDWTVILVGDAGRVYWTSPDGVRYFGAEPLSPGG